MAKPRKSKKSRGHHMNKEWIDLHETHESPLFWVDLSADSRIANLKEKFARVEKRAQELLEMPREFLSQFRRKLHRSH